MIKIVKKPDQKEVTTIMGKDVHKIIEKLYNDFRVILYKELDITMDQFLSFFHEDPLENKLLSAYDVGGAKGFKSEFYRKKKD